MLNNRIKRFRSEQGLMQKDLAKLTGISVQSLCSLEQGKSLPKAENMYLISKALKKPVYEVFVFEKTNK